MAGDFEKYKEDMTDDIATCLDSMGVQPILFVGSGMSQRYFGGPNWNDLLKALAEECPILDKSYAYYKQKNNSLIEVGAEFSEAYREWAWGEGSDQFPEELFTDSQPPDIYFKHKVSEYFEEVISPDFDQVFAGDFSEEIEALKSIRPHALITTNYDRFFEQVFLIIQA
ncbi:hypothetical protein A8U91_04060 [Halomonas elongata]|uniref:SIR2-like domain-containing protein n=1 Tax=Halomonas elongata TaxID=2746 RepID=A0A1B8NYB2_HALEL|nr:hypothetical protein [Halomonas elongata]OBX34997.1 hypothetical protein A8U91_04060 [Halomonas elongata]